ncbi:protein angel homolog 2 isoform X2 [Oryzias melastigma]|uniref:Angel homolog 2 (Drosophila) n=1 Tax=Oryzias melastigma TaxID=30732 RepID=A0A3B3CLE5_ORYME|nr:protein angel homolog 2 isoform X2 [Oryzias melastigma]
MIIWSLRSPPMFLLALRSSRPPLRALPSSCWTCRSSTSHIHPHPWPPPPSVPPSLVFRVRTPPTASSCASFHSSAGMELPDRDPPRKRIRTGQQRGDAEAPLRGQVQDFRGNPPPKPPHTDGRGRGNVGQLVGGQRSGVRPAGLHRHWQTCSSAPPPRGAGPPFLFSVLSYNILSQQLLDDNAVLYRHCPPAVLSWDHRLPNLLAEIRLLHADIVCLQEVQEDHYHGQILAALQALGYHCEYKKRTGQKPDGVAVAFRTSRFHLLSSNAVEFFRPGDPLLDRDNVGLVLQLQPRDGRSQPSSICVANTHLLYNPRRGDIKLTQLAILLAEVQRLARLPDGSSDPVLLCGDFNSAPWSPLYTFLTRGRLEYQGMQIGMVSGQESAPRGQRLLPFPLWPPNLGISPQCQYEASPGESHLGHVTPPSHRGEADGRGSSVGATPDPNSEDQGGGAGAVVCRSRIEHGLTLRSAYRHLQPDGRPEITTFHSRTALTVDYILYSPVSTKATPPFSSGRGLQLMGRLSLVGQEELEEVNGLPNQYQSSDHLPLLARFRLLH